MPNIHSSKVNSWKNVVEYIKKIRSNYDKNIKNISDVINNLREIRLIFKVEKRSIFFEDIFFGLGLFLENLNENELQLFINTIYNNILYYGETIETVLESQLSINNNVYRVSLKNAKSILACSILSVMPFTMTVIDTSSVTLQQLYSGISHGSKNHSELLKSIFRYFLIDPIQAMESEQNIFITITLRPSEPTSIAANEPLQSWPIILKSKTAITTVETPNSTNLWPMYFSKLLPFNFFNNQNLTLELPIYSKLPVLIPLLPLLTSGMTAKMGIITIKSDNFHCSIQNVNFLHSWDRRLQYSKEFILENLDQSLLALKSSQKRKHTPESNFANNFTHSIIEDAILKLNFKSSVLSHPNRSNSFTDPIQQTRSSLTSNILPFNIRGSREGSLSNNLLTRSNRHSYSTSSSSRSESLQLSSLSSRRSSSNTSSSSNKDNECSAISGDKVDHSLHIFQPVIVEESGNHVEDDEVSTVSIKPTEKLSFNSESNCLQTPIKKLMSASICDSTKMSLSKEVLCDSYKPNNFEYGMKRRNSSPILRQLLQEDNDDVQLIFEQKQLYNRCCEEDANNDHLIRLHNRGRRQSLPCHLQWLYQLPLTDSTKLNLSHSHSLIDNTDNLYNNFSEEPSYDFLEGQIMGDSKKTLTKLVGFVDIILDDIFLNEKKHYEQKCLADDILEKRKLFEEYSNDDNTEFDQKVDRVSYDNHCLHSGDLATFDRVLNSSTFFDNDAQHFFSQLSTMSSSSDTWIPGEHFCYGDSDDVITPVSNPKIQIKKKYKSNNRAIVDYVHQLTSSIISDAVNHDFSSLKISKNRPSCKDSVFDFAERMSLEILTTSFVQLVEDRKKSHCELSPIYIRPFPIEYDRQLVVLIQMIAGAIHQQETGRPHLMVFDRVSVEMEEIFNLLSKEKIKCNPEEVLRAILKILNETGSISISNLISYLMHNY